MESKIGKGLNRVPFICSLAIFAGFAIGEPKEPAKEISVLELINHPDQYDGKVVAVYGYARVKFEGNALYASKESLKFKLPIKDGVWLKDLTLNQKNKQLDGLQVIVRGTFLKSEKGHMGMWPAGIQVTEIIVNEVSRK